MSEYQRNKVEQRIIELYNEHRRVTSTRRWGYQDYVPWELGRNFVTDPWKREQVRISPELAIAVETAYLTELNLPWFTAGLDRLFQKAYQVLRDFLRVWTSEESQHTTLLGTYLLVTRNINPVRLSHLSDTVLQNAWFPGEATILEGMAYTTVQEMATQAFYASVALQADKEDPVLAKLLRRIAKDESLHYKFYLEAVRAYLDADPNLIIVVADTLRDFAMPGRLMPGFKERQLVISAGANYGIAQYYRQVASVVARAWKIDKLLPTYPESIKALRDVNRYLDWLASKAVQLEEASTSPDQLEEQMRKINKMANDLLSEEGPFITESFVMTPQLGSRNRKYRELVTEFEELVR